MKFFHGEVMLHRHRASYEFFVIPFQAKSQNEMQRKRCAGQPLPCGTELIEYEFDSGLVPRLIWRNCSPSGVGQFKRELIAAHVYQCIIHR